MVRVVTNSFVPLRDGGPYWRVSLYEFRGDPAVAFFVEDLGSGAYSTETSQAAAQKIAKEMGIIFCPGITAFSSIDKVYQFTVFNAFNDDKK